MEQINKKELSERDICTKYITPAISQAGWDLHTQIREEVTFTKGRVIVKGQSVSRGKPKRADYILYYKQNIPIAVIEAKNNTYGVGEGMQQALVNEDTYLFWFRRCPPEPSDIIFTREAPMREATIIPEGVKYCLGQRTMLIRPMHKYILNSYPLIALTEPQLLERATPAAVG